MQWEVACNTLEKMPGGLAVKREEASWQAANVAYVVEAGNCTSKMEVGWKIVVMAMELVVVELELVGVVTAEAHNAHKLKEVRLLAPD